MNTGRARSKRQWNRRVAPLLLTLCGLFPGTVLPGANPESPAGNISGTVRRIDVQGNSAALAGILITLRVDAEKAAQLSTRSDTNGHFQFIGLTAGRYVLAVNLDGFKPFAATVNMQPGQSQVQDVHLELATVAVGVEVQGQSAEVTEHTSDPDTTLTENQIQALPMAQQKYTEALPVVPGVVRTMNGTLNIKGAAETQGMLLVDSMQMVDPVTGSFSVGVPLAGIDTLNVFETPYSAQYGGFSGGLAAIETKSPPNQWQYSLMDFVPGIRGKNGHFSGVSVETPRAFLGGPLIKNKVNISEAFDYTIKNRPVRGQPWPRDENKLGGFNSFTDVQAILSPKHLLTANAVVFSSRTQFADINALVPETASSNSGSKGGFATLIATDVFSAGTLNTVFRYTRFESNAYGQGDQDLLMTPEGLSGNAFNRWTRRANQFEVMPSFQLTRKKWHGSHELRLGTDVVHQYYHGTTHSDPIQVLREDHSLAESIDFSGSNALHGRETEVSEFVQDHWVANDRLAIDSGFRVTSQSEGRSGAFAPRLGLVYSLDKTHKTVLRAGTGVFYDRVPLLALSFPQNPTRVVTLYNQAGLPIGGPVTLQNAYLDFTSAGPIVRTSGSPGSGPRDVRWNVEL